MKTPATLQGHVPPDARARSVVRELQASLRVFAASWFKLVLPRRQRGLVGATLVRAMFDRAGWRCKLFCCWCAQDIEANRFWESLGFVALAFRAESRQKRRVHIFWQRRIRAGDMTTPWWFPSPTSSGSIRQDRLVFKQKNDLKLIAAARELRDRWLEEVNNGRFQLEARTKYDVARQLTDGRATPCDPTARLLAA